MMSPRQVIFFILASVLIRLPAHERACGWFQSGGSHNSDVDRLATPAQVQVASGPAASEHLPVALVSVGDSYHTDSNSQR